MVNYPYRCSDCGYTAELAYPMGQAPSELPCAYCGGIWRQDYAAKRVQITPLKEVEREENRITEEDLPTDEALAALQAFAKIPQGTQSTGGSALVSFGIGGDG